MSDEEKKAEEKLVAVKIVARGEKMAIVEVQEKGVPKRISIPLKEIKDYKVAPSVLAKGVLYGIPYETLDYPKLSAETIGAIMRNYNLWTPADIRTHPKEVQAAFSEICSGYLTTIFNYIKDK